MTGSPRQPWWRRHGVLLLYVVATAVVTIQHLALGPDGYKVFSIFRTGSLDLLAGRNMYAIHTSPPLDHFRYSPAFALFFVPIALLPVTGGLAAWNAINAFGLYVAIDRLLPPARARLVQLLVLSDLVRSLQYSHSNGLVAAVMVAAFVAYERGAPARGAWAVSGGAAIKIFPGVMGLFALLRPPRGRALAMLVAAAVFLALVPALVLGPAGLIHQYAWWWNLELAEVFKPNYSLMDMIDAWSGHYWPRWPTQLAGVALLLMVVARRHDAWHAAAFRLRLFAAVMVFAVLFNHGAESPSYVIAMTGIATWWAATPRSPLHNVLLLFTLLLVTVGRSDLVPHAWRVALLDTTRAMVLPLLVVWIVMLAELWRWPAGASPGEAAELQVAAT